MLLDFKSIDLILYLGTNLVILLNKKFDLTVFLTSTTGTSRTNSSNAS